MAQRLELAQKDFGEAAVKSPGSRLGQGVGCTQGQGCHGLLGAFLGKRGDDHHLGASSGSNDPRNRLETSGTRHFQVKDDDIDPNFMQRIDRIFSGPRDRRDFEGVIRRDHPRQNRPGDHRIVDDHQPDATVCWGFPQAVPRSGERPLHPG